MHVPASERLVAWARRLGPGQAWPHESLPGVQAMLGPAERERLLATQIRLVLDVSRNVAPSLLGALLLAGVAGVVLDSLVRQVAAACWLLVMVVLTLAVYRLARAPRDPDAPMAVWRDAARTLGLYCLVWSAVWGLSTWIVLDGAQPALMAPMAIAVTLVIAGTSMAAVHPATHLKLLLPITVVGSLGLARFGDPVSLSLAAGIWLAAAAVWHPARSLRVALTDNLAMRMHSEQLLARMAEQQRITDDALRRAQASQDLAEAANRSKSAFLAAAGHDLRQPMHALVQYVGHLQRINQDPRLADTVLRIGRSLDSMQNLLDSILDISKLMMGAVRPQPASFRLADLLDGLDAQMRPIAEGKGLQLAFDRCEALVHTDPLLLERVLRNLVLNAIRYTPAGRVSVRCRQRGQALRVAVCDTGIGIPRDLQAKVFEEFFQVDNAARDSRRGLGLGLSLVSQLCTLLGLRLQLRSRPGVGSVFIVQVPLGQPAARPAADAAAPPRDRVRGAFVVLIDDNPESLEATAATLALFGCRVLAAASGIEALDRLQQQEQVPHLVISDLRLAQGETGIEAVRMVIDNQRALLGDAIEIPALIVSGDTSPAEMARVRDAGLAMLHKPLAVDALYAAVNAALTRLALADPD